VEGPGHLSRKKNPFTRTENAAQPEGGKRGILGLKNGILYRKNPLLLEDQKSEHRTWLGERT